MRRARLSQRRGYTAVEVLVALTIFAIGAAGVIAMQRASVMGNVDARRLDTANAITRTTLERLRTEAMMWPAGTNLVPPAVAVNFADTNRWDGSWQLPLGGGAITGGFDAFGVDAPLAGAIFCANVSLVPVATDNGRDPPTGIPRVFRAEVRVFWPRGLGTATPAVFCAAGGGGADQQKYHFVQASTFIGPTPLS